ncbi:helix-turn-helix domain-containing protein [Mesorhizobium erdmanii]|uniref:helix-turn-helix domain-containing protein n=1 Tax=Mesorhizobium erdmanii TaxID=1777866 RepID=UPI000686E9E1|nr:helix-turn-helix domain-containing protein [Mesorhizobium erdmanii]
MEFLSKHRVFASGDLDEGANFAGQVWERNRSIKTDDLRYGIRWNQLDMEKIGFSYIEHDCAVDLTAQGPLSDHFRIFFHEDGSIGHTVNGKKFDSHAGNAVTHAPDTDLHLDINPFKLLLLTVDAGVIRIGMQQRFRKVPEFSNWVGSLPDSARLATMRSMAKWMASEAERDGSPIAAPGNSRMHAQRLLLSLIVECLSETSPIGFETVLDISRAQVRRAEEWIDAHLTDAIGIDEVAAATGVGVRSLQQYFKRVHDCSPYEFLIRRRLEAARQKLLVATPETTVTAIATDLGFFELGRFAERYRHRFAETPSTTLARGRGVRKP